jgi:hypothetical protein
MMVIEAGGDSAARFQPGASLHIGGAEIAPTVSRVSDVPSALAGRSNCPSVSTICCLSLAVCTTSADQHQHRAGRHGGLGIEGLPKPLPVTRMARILLRQVDLDSSRVFPAEI